MLKTLVKKPEIAGMATPKQFQECGVIALVAWMGLLLNGFPAMALSAESGSGFPMAASPARPPFPKLIYTFDARPWRSVDARDPARVKHVWDTLHLLSAIQGLANRQTPSLYIYYCREFGLETDTFWFDWLRQEDGWLKETEVKSLASVEEVIANFRDRIDGLVVYDPAVPATANLASTAAGCLNLLPVRYDPGTHSLFSRLTGPLGVPVKLWLVNSDGSSKFTGRGLVPDSHTPTSGSAKVDAYTWAIQRFVRSGQCDPKYAAYYIDSHWLKLAGNGPGDLHTLSNHDYFISRKAFFFDLSPWGDETPNDDPQQPMGADRKAFLQVLEALYRAAGGAIIKVGGFPPWPYKYTNHGKVGGKHEGVPTEWEFGRLISQYNGYMEADAASLSALANASFFQHYPLAARYPQPNRPPTVADWKRKGLVTDAGKVAARFFVGHYVGDYDAPSWLYKALPAFFRDPARGSVPLGWAFNPNLADRVPQVLAYAYRNATTNDFFIAGDSGAGYLNARALTVRPESHLASGLEVWRRHCQDYYQRWDMTISGFVLDGSAGAATEQEFAAYRSFSPDGAGTHFEKGPRMLAGIPTCPERDLPDSAEAAAKVIADQASARRTGPGFLWARSILKSPQWYLDVQNILKNKHGDLKIEVVDPYTFFGLIKLKENAGKETKP